MKSIRTVFLQYLRQQVRDKYAIFWNMVFPLLLMSILVLVFGGFEDGSVVFQVSMVNFEEEQSDENFSMIINQVFTDLARDEQQNWLVLHKPGADESKEEFLAREKELLEKGDRHALLVIPEGINDQILNKIRYQFLPAGEESEAGQLTIYRNSENQISSLSADIISGIISDINKEINIRSGLIDKGDLVQISRNQITTAATGESFSMVDYLLPGIILMTFLSSGLEIFVEKISARREKGILRRYFATPMRPGNYFTGIFLFIIVISLIQVLLIYGWGRIFFGFNLNIFTPVSIFLMLYSLIVFLSLGFFILSVVRSQESAGTMTQAFIYPMMFLGGLFFPVMGLPGLLRIIVLINPVTYLINGLRDVLGVYPSPTSFIMNITVPAVWLIAGIIISSRFFNWNPGGEK